MAKNKTEIHVTTVFDGELDATDAVSYTHLDVYKRQVRDCYCRSGKLVQQTRVTCKGKNHLFKLFKKWGVIE